MAINELPETTRQVSSGSVGLGLEAHTSCILGNEKEPFFVVEKDEANPLSPTKDVFMKVTTISADWEHTSSDFF